MILFCYLLCHVWQKNSKPHLYTKTACLTSTCAQKCMHDNVHVYMHVRGWGWGGVCVCVYVCVCVCACMCVCVRARVCVCVCD